MLTVAVAFAVADAEGAVAVLPYLDLKEAITSASMLWGVLSSLGGVSSEIAEALAVTLAAESGAHLLW